MRVPHTIVLRLGWGGRRGMVYLFASQPVAADRCAGYVVIGRNYNLDQPHHHSYGRPDAPHGRQFST